MKNLEKLVDDYLTKHESAIAAGRHREWALKHADESAQDAATDAFVKAHNARAASFRALQKVRGFGPKHGAGVLDQLWDKLARRA